MSRQGLLKDDEDEMKIAEACLDHMGGWALLRYQLWPNHTIEKHRDDIARFLSQGKESSAAFIALGEADDVIGFVETTLRRDYVNGCKSSPVLFLEGIYVRPDHRRKGVARQLCEAAEAWGKLAGCKEFGSDTLLDNRDGQLAHAALGFQEIERVVFFRQSLEE